MPLFALQASRCAGVPEVTHTATAAATRVESTTLIGLPLRSLPRSWSSSYDPGSNRLVLPTRSGAVALVNPQTLALAGTVPSSPALTAAAVDPGTCRLWMLDYTYHRVWSVPYKRRCA